MAEQTSNKKPAWITWLHVLFLGSAYLLAIALIALSIWGQPLLRRILNRIPGATSPQVTATPSPTPEATPLPTRFIPRQEIDLANLFYGHQYQTRLETSAGTHATQEKATPDAFRIDVAVEVRVPEANRSLEALTELNPQLTTVLPALPDLLIDAKVSDFYHAIYDLKTRRLQSHLQRVDRLVSRHNFYDVETILELRHPSSGRKILFIQSEMDVVADGSDPDRTLKVEGSYTHFQPFTSYRWRRQTQTSNPFAEERKTQLAEVRQQLTSATNEEREGLLAREDQLKREIFDLERFSFLVARGDPYIVLPGFMRRDQSLPFAPELGDYAVVIYGDTIYPAIFGDVGPSYKMGEASLFICQTINPRSTAYSRPVSDLTITYLVFPGSRDEAGPPDLERWRTRCEELLNELGGYGGTLHVWENVFQ